jgi:multiple sugar transport system permease protein
VTFIPSYVVVAHLGGVNTLWGIVVPGLFNAFATFLFRQFYLDFPVEIEEAGRIDGLGYFGIYRALILPNSLGIMMALGILSFIYSWNAFLWPLVISHTPSSWTVQIVLSTFLTAQTINLPELFMGAAIGAAPLVYLYQIALGDQNFGLGAAGAFILFALILIVTLIQGRILGFGRKA